MTRVPRKREIDRSLAAVAKQVRRAVSELNKHAATLVAGGKYSAADGIVELARAVSGFETDVERLRLEWRQIGHSGDVGDEERAGTPLEGYFKPILEALDQLGGTARRSQLEDLVQESMKDVLHEEDFTLSRRGTPRWKAMIRRARRPMTVRGWLVNKRGAFWVLTEEGRARAAAEDDA